MPVNKTKNKSGSFNNSFIPEHYNEDANTFLNNRRSDVNGKTFSQLVAEKKVLNINP